MTVRGDRDGVTARSPQPAFRLKRSLEPFAASDGTLYLLRSGVGDDYLVAEPRAEDRLLLDRLARGFATEAELREALEADGLDGGAAPAALADLERAGLVERSATDELSGEQRERYDRQLIYLADLAAPGIPAELLQRRLAASTVVLVGCGGLGSWTACGLACAGIGSLVLIDDDRVELSNLNRQLLFSEADVGRLKVEAAASALRRNNSSLRVSRLRHRVRGPGDLAEPLAGAQLLIATADWPPYELPRWVNRACLRTGVPYITAGQFLPQVRVGPMVIPGRTACLECLERAARNSFPLYDELAEHRSKRPIPAATLGAASGVVGSLLAMEAIHLLSGAREPASLNRALILDLATMAMREEPISRDPACPRCCGSEQRGGDAEHAGERRGGERGAVVRAVVEPAEDRGAEAVSDQDRR
jgi:bacteriocin biosynthesis cyclodehydratase domain-containing protein